MYIVQGPDNKDIKILIGQASGFVEADIDKLAKIIQQLLYSNYFTLVTSYF
ncbi:MAG: hypothetical protein RMY32_008310 [Nostoc sp. ChiSLP03a]